MRGVFIADDFNSVSTILPQVTLSNNDLSSFIFVFRRLVPAHAHRRIALGSNQIAVHDVKVPWVGQFDRRRGRVCHVALLDLNCCFAPSPHLVIKACEDARFQRQLCIILLLLAVLSSRVVFIHV